MSSGNIYNNGFFFNFSHTSFTHFSLILASKYLIQQSLKPPIKLHLSKIKWTFFKKTNLSSKIAELSRRSKSSIMKSGSSHNPNHIRLHHMLPSQYLQNCRFPWFTFISKIPSKNKISPIGHLRKCKKTEMLYIFSATKQESFNG